MGEQNHRKYQGIFDDSIKPLLDRDFPITDFPPNTFFDPAPRWNLRSIGIFADTIEADKFYTGKLDSKQNVTKPYHWKIKYLMLVLFLHDKLVSDANTRIHTNFISKELLTRMEERIKWKKVGGRNKLKFIGYSGHETNVIAFVLGYKLSSLECLLKTIRGQTDNNNDDLSSPNVCFGIPGFGSSLTWELNRRKTSHVDSSDPGDYFVRVLFNGQPLTSHCPP